MIIIYLNGNIGAGKTTLINLLDDNKYIKFLEPINEWKYLEKYYEDMTKYSLMFQLEIILFKYKQILDMIKNNIENKIIIVERSFNSGFIFMDILKQNNHLTNEEYNVIKIVMNKIELDLSKIDVEQKYYYIKCDIENIV